MDATTADGPQNTSWRLYIYDMSTRTWYLIDTGADISVLPPRATDRSNVDKFKLYAANNTIIDTYGERVLKLDLGLRREFLWRFIVADVKYPIIGADLLAHYNLLPDLKNKQLVDSTTSLCSKCRYAETSQVTINSLGSHSPDFSKLLADYPGITQPTARRTCKTAHNTVHLIETTGQPVFAKARRLPPEKLNFVRRMLEDLMRQGDIRPSNSSWASPIHVVKKKGPEKWRLTGDYRRLNAITVPDRYPVPNILDFNANLQGAVVFTSIDIKRAYHQIPVAPSDIPKTAIITPLGLFEYVSTPFGLRNAAQTFQRFIHSILRGLDNVYAYLDDILIASSSRDTHESDVRAVLSRLHDAGIVINSAKSQYFVEEVSFLGYRVNADGIRPDPARVTPITEYKQPEDVAGLRRFMGMINFYRRNIRNAAEIQRRLQVLIKSNRRNDRTKVEWTDDALMAFEEFKRAITEATLLAHPREDAQLVLCTDASNTAVGGALHQMHGQKLEPLAFFSRKLSPTETRYSTYDRELLAIFAAVRHFRNQLEGRQFVIYSDHAPLQYAFTNPSEKASPRVVRQLDFISQFTTDIRYVPGVQNIPADFLSRIEGVGMDYALPYDTIAQSQQNDAELKQFLDTTTGMELKKVVVPGSDKQIYCDVSGTRCRPYLPQPFRKDAFNSVHRLSHPGPGTSAKLAAERYVWPGLKTDCRKWARSCIPCQRAKVGRHTKAPLGEFEATSRFAHLHIDIVGPLPPSKGMTYVITMIDRETRWPEAVPTSSITAEHVASVVVQNWVARFGAPIRITTDQGRQFESELFKHLSSKLGAHKMRTTAYHPAANGRIERWHRPFKAAIMAYATDNWTEILPLVLLGLRSAINSDLGVAPAQLTYGTSLRLPGEFFSDSDADNSIIGAKDFVERLSVALRKFARHSRRHDKSPVYVPASLASCNFVFLRAEFRKGLEPPYTGPHRVITRDNKTVTIDREGKTEKVSIDRVKPAFILSDSPPTVVAPMPPVTSARTTSEAAPPLRRQPPRRVRFQGKYTR